jgi:hypothetical protein
VFRLKPGAWLLDHAEAYRLKEVVACPQPRAADVGAAIA